MYSTIITLIFGAIVSGWATASSATTIDFPSSCSRKSAPSTLPTSTIPNFKTAKQSSDVEGKRAALDLVFRMENGRDPYRSVTGNFDGQGLSLGVIQFNLAGSAQKAFKSVDRKIYVEKMPQYGGIFWDVIHSEGAHAIDLSLQLQNKVNVGGRTVWSVIPAAREELAAFLGSEIVRDAQNRGASLFYDRAFNQASQWAREARGVDKPSNREIAFFFDQSVFNGGSLSGIWLPQAMAFRSKYQDDGQMIKAVSEWLASCPKSGKNFLHGTTEGIANADRWRASNPVGAKLSDEKALLFAQGFLRALMSNGPPSVPGQPDQRGVFKAQVMNRRGMIALGQGLGNGVEWPGGELDK